MTNILLTLIVIITIIYVINGMLSFKYPRLFKAQKYIVALDCILSFVTVILLWYQFL